jgi:predicted outer membrane repeat protein
MHNSHNASPEIRNCTFSGNEAEMGGGIYSGTNSSPTITNCIVWNNYAGIGTEELYNDGTSTAIVTYSDVKGGWPGEGNIGLDLDLDNPLFVNGPGGYNYLSQSATGDPDQSSDSPCVDTGSDTAANLGLDEKTTRTDGVPDTGTVDMGYHYEPIVLTL